jgi:hypothetical protein
MSGRREGEKKKKEPPLKTCLLFFQPVTPAISLASHGSVNWHTAAVQQWKKIINQMEALHFLFSF